MTSRRGIRLYCDHPGCPYRWPGPDRPAHDGPVRELRLDAAEHGWTWAPEHGDRCPAHPLREA